MQHLDEFDEHATCFHVFHTGRSLPDTVRVVVEAVQRTPSKPPAVTALDSTRARAYVVVTVRRAEHHRVGVPRWIHCRCHRVASVSAVPVDRQLVVTVLITDRKSRVFGPIPLIVSTFDLTIHTLDRCINNGEHVVAVKAAA